MNGHTPPSRSPDRHRQLSLKTGILGDSEKIVQLLETIEQVAPTDITVLISGESGSCGTSSSAGRNAGAVDQMARPCPVLAGRDRGCPRRNAQREKVWLADRPAGPVRVTLQD